MAGLEGLLTGHTLVKRYTIKQVIGRGGFAVVYEALDKRLNRPVAVKVITLTALDEGLRDQMRQRLQREARAAASLPHHPNLVTVHDVGTDPQLGLDFLVMEMLWGQNLSQYFIHHGRPSLHDGLRILRDAAEGLAIGHRAGLIHRDVKPANIFLAEPASDDEPTRVCLLDYGIAQAMEDDATVTRGANTPLSPAYASPEQLSGTSELTPATDVFSLGVVGYQLLTNERPFATKAGEAPTAWAVRRPIRAFNPRVPARVEAVLMRAMSENPADRYPHAAAFAEALDAAQLPDDVTAVAPAHVAAGAAANAIPATPVAAPPADDVTALAPAPPPVRGDAPRRPPSTAAGARPMPPLRPAAPARKGGSGWIVGVVLALLVGAGAMWAMFGRGGDEGTQQASDRPARDTASVTQPAAPAPTDVTGTMTVDTGAIDMPPVSTGEPSTAQPEPGIATGVNPTFPAASQPSATPRPSTPASRPTPPVASQPEPSETRPSRPRPTTPVEQQPEPEPTPPVTQPQPPVSQPEPPVVLPPASPPVYTPIPAPAPVPSRPAPVDTIFIPSTPPDGARGK